MVYSGNLAAFAVILTLNSVGASFKRIYKDQKLVYPFIESSLRAASLIPSARAPMLFTLSKQVIPCT